MLMHDQQHGDASAYDFQDVSFSTQQYSFPQHRPLQQQQPQQQQQDHMNPPLQSPNQAQISQQQPRRLSLQQQQQPLQHSPLPHSPMQQQRLIHQQSVQQSLNQTVQQLQPMQQVMTQEAQQTYHEYSSHAQSYAHLPVFSQPSQPQSPAVTSTHILMSAPEINTTNMGLYGQFPSSATAAPPLLQSTQPKASSPFAAMGFSPQQFQSAQATAQIVQQPQPLLSQQMIQQIPQQIPSLGTPQLSQQSTPTLSHQTTPQMTHQNIQLQQTPTYTSSPKTKPARKLSVAKQQQQVQSDGSVCAPLSPYVIPAPLPLSTAPSSVPPAILQAPVSTQEAPPQARKRTKSSLGKVTLPQDQSTPEVSRSSPTMRAAKLPRRQSAKSKPAEVPAIHTIQTDLSTPVTSVAMTTAQAQLTTQQQPQLQNILHQRTKSMPVSISASLSEVAPVDPCSISQAPPLQGNPVPTIADTKMLVNSSIAAAAVKDEAKTNVEDMLLMSATDRDKLLATMLAESDYADPPMTRSEYIASLADIPALVTTVPYNRLEYFAKSSIPSDMTPEAYAREGIEAAIASRLPPFALHELEYELLKFGVNHLHVTTYLNIRNGILRLWRMNHLVSVTRTEAAGCARDLRFFGLAEAAYEFLLRYGYINFGVIDIPRCRNNFPYTLPISSTRRPRLRIVVIGAGVSGLGCARQLDGLFKQYDDFMSGYEETPEIVILEGRQRIGGRVYSAPLSKDEHEEKPCKVDLGAQIVTGFSNGNPLSVIIRKQLGIPCSYLKDVEKIHEEVSRSTVSASIDKRVQRLYNDMLDRVSVYRAPSHPGHRVEGDASLITAGKDPSGDGGRTIGKMEANAVELPPLEKDAASAASLKQNQKTPLDVKLEDIGYAVKKTDTPVQKLVTDPLPRDGPANLGATLDGQLEIVRKLVDLTEQDIRILNWHYANLEYANATRLDTLSLSSWDQDDGNEFSGQHAMVKDGGLMQVPQALYLFPSKLDVRFKTAVKAVHYDASKEGRKKFTVSMESGEQISADRVVCTVPLGVLKSGSVQFSPELSPNKKSSISNLGFGVLNKVVLVYDHCFWDAESDFIGIARGHADSGNPYSQDSYANSRGRFYMFWNCMNVVGKNCLVALLAGQAAYDTSTQTDDALIQEATTVLSRIYPNTQISYPKETLITRWHMDPYSLGSYSYVGPSATGKDYDNLAAPEHEDNLFFAGEATSRTHPATVHGAYLSGLRCAEQVFRSVVGDIELASPLVKPKVRATPLVPQTETVRFPPPPKSAYVGDTPPVLPKPALLPQIPTEAMMRYSAMVAGSMKSTTTTNSLASVTVAGVNTGSAATLGGSVAVPASKKRGRPNGSATGPRKREKVVSAGASASSSPAGTAVSSSASFEVSSSVSSAVASSVGPTGSLATTNMPMALLPRTMSPTAALPMTTPTPGLAQAISITPQLSVQSNISRGDAVTHLARARALRDDRIAAHERAYTLALHRALGTERPIQPDKPQLNPFIVYQKREWEHARLEADTTRRAAEAAAPGSSANTLIVARAAATDIRSIIGLKWRGMGAADKQPYVDETNRNRAEHERRMQDYKERMVVYEDKVAKFREEWVRANESVESEEEKQEIELARAGGIRV
ncbi:flavin-containing amine oxidoreductase-domain containing protein [Limtongia smithiae]|uniref:flavin-containing amine oxidoreductase-domain containing protein n=1 Tax=Limtongia smithiae TaxID=1125753 RepID=UPI0034CF587F